MPDDRRRWQPGGDLKQTAKEICSTSRIAGPRMRRLSLATSFNPLASTCGPNAVAASARPQAESKSEPPEIFNSRGSVQLYVERLRRSTSTLSRRNIALQDQLRYCRDLQNVNGGYQMKFDVKWFIAALIVSLLTIQPSNSVAGLIEDLQNADAQHEGKQTPRRDVIHRRAGQRDRTHPGLVDPAIGQDTSEDLSSGSVRRTDRRQSDRRRI